MVPQLLINPFCDIQFISFSLSVVNKLAIRRYQPHLHELLLMLNFNSFYTRRYDSLH